MARPYKVKVAATVPIDGKPIPAAPVYAGGWCVSQWAGDALLSNQQEVNQGSSGIASLQRHQHQTTKAVKQTNVRRDVFSCRSIEKGLSFEALLEPIEGQTSQAK